MVFKNIKFSGLEGNITKMFFFLFTQRRHIIPLFSLFFFMLPDANAKLLGIFTAFAYLVSFFLEIPSGYFADYFGHKNTLILSKIVMIFSMTTFYFGDTIYWYFLASTLLSISFAFQSGSISALMHNTLEDLRRESEFGKIMGRIRGNVSLVAVLTLTLLPFLTSIDFKLPFLINLIIDFFGLAIVLSFVNPSQHFIKKKKEEKKSINELIVLANKFNFYSVSIFSGATAGFFFAEVSFRYLYLDLLGFPLVYVGIVAGGSRVVWFLVARYAYLIKKYLTMKQHFLIEVFLMPLIFISMAFFSNPYFVGIISAMGIGYMFGRSDIVTQYILDDYLPDKNYKATFLSINGQVSSMIKFVATISVGFIMDYSFKLGYYVLGTLLFITLIGSYYFIRKH
mgnify:CR=1 FL=1